MSLRCCVYKNCGNYINLKDRTANDVKLFSFPKNPERRQKWIELGKVSSNISETMYYFCSDHFDKKYMAINNRRTVLVGEAVPFPYVETEIDETYAEADGNMDFYLYEINGDKDTEKQNFLDGQDIHVESTTIIAEMQDNFQSGQVVNNLDEQLSEDCIIFTDDDRDNQESSITYSNKRKLDNATIVQTGTALSKSKILKTSPLHKTLRRSLESTNTKSPYQMVAIKTLSSSNPNNRSLSKDISDKEIDIEEFVDQQRVTTFIYKGEEYVQMSKEHYIREKSEVLKKLRKMENALKAIKGIFNELDG